MANIMITNVCNLNCSYCFANDYVNKQGVNNISISAFTKAIDFILTAEEEEHIGIIGGEPTLHPHFDQLLDIVIADQRIKKVIIFTNGINIDKYKRYLTHEKISLLINVNNPDVIGLNNWMTIKANIAGYIDSVDTTSRLTVGLNIYDPDISYDYIFEMLDEFELSALRLSVIVPNEATLTSRSSLQFFEQMKGATLSVILRCLNNGIIPFYDCNKIPMCVWNEKEQELLYSAFSNDKFSNIIDSKSICTPVIDIMQDLTAVRCFGMSDYLSVNIDNFETIDDLRGFFVNEIDVFAYRTINDSQCYQCYERNCKKCTGGCMAYKANAIFELSSLSDQLIKKGDD